MTYRSIELNLMTSCPIQCPYCPQNITVSSYIGQKTNLEIKDLDTILNNATSQNSPIEVFFSGFSEPLASKNWLEMVLLCHENNLVRKVVVFTTGYQLQSKEIKLLSELNKFRFNFHISKNKKTLLPQLDAISHYLPNSVFRGVGTNEHELDEIREVLTRYKLNFLFQKIIFRAGNVGEKESINHPVTCCKTETERRPIIMPDGTTLICSNDYGCEMPIGNLIKQKWETLRFQNIKNLQNDPNSNIPCFRKCHLASRQIKII